ncbi:(2Fe-2S)-binding protein [Streptosporangium sp. NBC_01755]|uniref:(2Fe-2S)-binding protein n=1 Tax=unclassified Streptosporangium TaxID=2632669 RepID=UPI002DD7D027|nr:MULTISPECIES: (2Fe-2S)-binding protein [unclassified Streptosporangium]WSA27910.1 (2Fe-2S)-binding protein [Streptosporangium sp. NBC_01810]WSD00618.1 (2Fe-2S)-binding protein [Streptosporangium sp. NBC_01755]
MTETTEFEPNALVQINVEVNGRAVSEEVPTRLLLSDFLRHRLRLTGTHVGCEHGVCGACTVHIDGTPARSCLTLAVQVDGCSIRTVEGLANADGSLHPVQQAFKECHALQCGFCTPGFMMAVAGLLDERDDLRTAEDDSIREDIAGNVCRCTGYMNIVSAVRRAAELTNEKG